MSKRLKIIHLEVSQAGVTAAKQALSSGELAIEIRAVHNREQFIQSLNDFIPDVLLTEFALPDIHCSEAVALLRERGIDIPFIIFSDAISDKMAGEILLTGADDYVIKGQDSRLLFAVVRCLEKFQFKKEQLHLLEQLSNNKKRYRTLIEYSADAVVILDAETKPTYVSPAVKNVLGYTPEEILNMDLFTISHPDDARELPAVFEKVMANPGVPIQGHTGRMLHKDGQWRWIEATVTNLLHEPAINGIVDNFRDVTNKKASDEKILQLNRLYAFLSQVNHTLGQAPDPQTIFREVCRIACETGQFEAAWIGVTNATNDRKKMVESQGISEAYLPGFTDAVYEQRELGIIFTSQPYYVSNNTRHEFISDQWKSLAEANGYLSCMVLPIKMSGGIIGSFNLYASATDFFTAEETTLLQEAANGISFALDFFEKERLRLAADERLKHKEWRLSQAQAIAHLGSWEMDLSTEISVWSDEACRIYGLPTENNIQSTDSWLSFVHPDDVEFVIKTNTDAFASLQAATYAHRIIRKDGMVRYLHAQTQFELDSTGKPVSLYGTMHDVTEMEKSQQALRSSESNLRAIFENTSEGFVLTDIHGIVLYFNSRARYFYRLTTGKEISLGGSLYDAVDDYRSEDFRKTITRVLSGKTEQFESLFKLDGEKRWLNATIIPVYENQLITGLTLTMTDITDRKIAQDLRQRSESNLNAIMNNTNALIYSLDTELRYITFNDALKNLMKERYNVDVMPGYDIRESMNKFDPDAGEEWAKINVRALSGEILEFEKTLRFNGANSYLRFSIHPIRKNNTVTGLSCFVNDITKEKEADEKVLKALEEKNVILESIGDCFYAVDRNWVVTYWNKQAEIVFDCPKETILGKYVWDVFPDVVDTLFYTSYHKAVETNTIQHFESYYERDSSWFEVTAYPSPSGLSVYLREITQRKQAERQLNELNKNLQKYADELVTSNKGLEQFSYIVSHNLRAPVANIIGLAELLEQNSYPADVKEEFLRGILVNVKRLDEVISDLNLILQAKRDVSENRELTNMTQLVNNIQSSIQRTIEKENVEIQTDFTAVNTLFTLKSYLYSIFYNLIMNSIKYRQKDISPVIRITSSLASGRVTITFQDNGMGIDLQKKGSQVFGLYKRFHSHVEGKGMGLFMVKTQVEILGGKISVNSVVNSGTEFCIEFPSNNYQLSAL
jgi:PAS domain S-box-containing protein